MLAGVAGPSAGLVEASVCGRTVAALAVRRPCRSSGDHRFGDGGRLQNWSARRLLGQPIRTTRVRGLLSLPLALLTLVIVGYGWSIVVLNVAYPIRPLLGLPGYDRKRLGRSPHSLACGRYTPPAALPSSSQCRGCYAASPSCTLASSGGRPR